jgi:uncharacterized membrane protein
MPDVVKRWYVPGLALAGVALSLAVYPRLPGQVVTHWDASGVPNGWMPRAVAAFLLPAVLLAVGALLRALPVIDPRRENYAKFAASYEFTIASVLVFLLLLHAVILAAALGYDVPVARVAPVLTGMLFVAMGNQLPRTRPNFWYGIRTPWTLSSDRVWARTHRVAGFAMTGAGLVMIVAGALLPPVAGVMLLVVAALASALGPAAYSYFAWKQEQAS